MSVQDEINRIYDGVTAIKAAITDKGVNVPDGTKIDGLGALVSSIPQSGSSSAGKVVRFWRYDAPEETGYMELWAWAYAGLVYYYLVISGTNSGNLFFTGDIKSVLVPMGEYTTLYSKGKEFLPYSSESNEITPTIDNYNLMIQTYFKIDDGDSNSVEIDFILSANPLEDSYNAREMFLMIPGETNFNTHNFETPKIISLWHDKSLEGAG